MRESELSFVLFFIKASSSVMVSLEFDSPACRHLVEEMINIPAVVHLSHYELTAASLFPPICVLLGVRPASSRDVNGHAAGENGSAVRSVL